MFYLPTDFPKVDLDFLAGLSQYLIKQPQSILRQIKKDFPHQENLEEELEKFISLGLIARKERRYESLVSYFPEDFFWKAFLAERLHPFVETLLAEEKLPVLNLWQTLKLPSRREVLAVSPFQKEEMAAFLVTAKTFSGKYQVTEIQTERPQTSLTNFFAGKKDTPRLEELTQIVGDVVPDYFLQQSLPKLWRAKEKSLRESRPDIFTDALGVLGLLSPEKITQQVIFPQNLSSENQHIKTTFAEILATFPFKEQPAIFQQLQLLAQGYVLTQLKEANYMKNTQLPLEKGWHVTLLTKNDEEERNWNTIVSR